MAIKEVSDVLFSNVQRDFVAWASVKPMKIDHENKIIHQNITLSNDGVIILNVTMIRNSIARECKIYLDSSDMTVKQFHPAGGGGNSSGSGGTGFYSGSGDKCIVGNEKIGGSNNG